MTRRMQVLVLKLESAQNLALLALAILCMPLVLFGMLLIGPAPFIAFAHRMDAAQQARAVQIDRLLDELDEVDA